MQRDGEGGRERKKGCGGRKGMGRDCEGCKVEIMSGERAGCEEEIVRGWERGMCVKERL
jgi:hypothetical protein